MRAHQRGASGPRQGRSGSRDCLGASCGTLPVAFPPELTLNFSQFVHKLLEAWPALALAAQR